jgi:predicted NBD/HSP70 family sugar kinase
MCLDELAQSIGLSIKEVNSQGFDGALIRLPGKPRGIVAVRKDIREVGRKRFTIAHEIGHYILPGHGASNAVCKDGNVESWGREVSGQEDAANRFASELLLPTTQLEPIVRKYSASIETARSISKKFQTSLTAAALKCVDLADMACVLVVTVDGVIRRYRSNKMWSYPIPVGASLVAGTIAKHLGRGRDQRSKCGSVLAEAWLKNPYLRGDGMLQEDSILLPNYNTILTILTVTETL